MSKLIKTDTSYAEWIKSVSLRFRQSQIKAAVKVNSELIRFYWELGRDIVEMKAEERWTENFWENLSRDLQTYLPGVKGFSITNLQYTRRFYLLYSMKATEHPQVGGALEGYSQPLGISEYELSKLYPAEFKGTLPSIEEIERELKDNHGRGHIQNHSRNARGATESHARY